MGAGLGLWSRLLHQHKVKTTAYDEAPPHKRKFNPWIPKQRTYFPVWKGGPRKLLKYSRETLLLVWPPYKESFAWECLKYHRGEFVAFVGEGWGGCTGDDEFFGELSTNYRLVERIPIPQWPGINDELFIYRTSKY